MESTLKRTWAEISLDNLTHNFETIRRQVGPKAKLLGVVKADAYGHGAVRVAKHLERLGAGYLAVSNLDECEELRVNGIMLPILMLGFTPADQAEHNQHDCQPKQPLIQFIRSIAPGHKPT